MKSYLILLSLLVFFIGSLLAQSPPVLQWQKCYGGTLDDFTRSLELTNDGGFIFCASTESNDGQVSGNHGEADFWLVKADASGSIEWQKCLGGTHDDYGWAMKQTADGGYVLAGFSNSHNGDVTGNHGNYDYWVVKTDASGNIQWQKTLGGSEYDAPYAIQQTSDHGYVIAGSLLSQDGDVTGAKGNRDAWIVKLDSTGNIQWQKDMGGSGVDDAFAVQQTTDGGYIVAGNTASNDGDVSGAHGNDDYWVVKLTAAGNIQWQHCYGGSASDVSRYVQQTPDGEFVVIGFTQSNNGDVTGNHGMNDIWVIKINSAGTLQWQKCYGGSGEDFGRWIRLTSDGGYLINGPSASSNGDVTGNHGGLDFWIAKLDSLRNIQWQKSVGGSLEEYDFAFQADNAGNYFLGGYTLSNDGDVTGNHGEEDVWIVKLSSACSFGIPTNLSTAKITATSATLKWHITGAPTGFKIQYKPTSSATWLNKNINNGTKTSYKLTGLTSSTQYEWQILEKCENQNSAYSASTLFTTLALKEGEIIAADHFDLRAYPNPSNGIFSLEVNGIISDWVMIEVIDLAGKILFEENVAVNNGTVLQEMDLQRFNGGYYLLRISDNGVVHTQPLILAE